MIPEAKLRELSIPTLEALARTTIAVLKDKRAAQGRKIMWSLKVGDRVQFTNGKTGITVVGKVRALNRTRAEVVETLPNGRDKVWTVPGNMISMAPEPDVPVVEDSDIPQF